MLVNWLVSESFRSPLLTPSAHFWFNKYKAKAQSLKANRQALDLVHKRNNRVYNYLHMAMHSHCTEKPRIAFLRKRIKRGLYRSGTGKLINADVERIKADLLPNMLATANANP